MLDSERYHAQSFAAAVMDLSGYELKPEEHCEFFSMHSTIFADVLNKRHGLRLSPQEVLLRKREHVKATFKAELFEGAREFLERWHGRVPFGLATNSPIHFVQPAMEEAGIFHLFDCVTTASEVKNRKPDPEIVEITLQRLQADPLKTLVFEDQLMGVEAALAAGANVVAVNNGQTLKYPPDIPFLSWKELLKLSEDA